MQTSVATCTIYGIAPYSSSRHHEEPKKGGELPGDYDKRTWREKLNTVTIDGVRYAAIPAHGMHQAIVAAAQYSKIKIPGQRNATWTAKFRAGVTISEAIKLDVRADDVTFIDIYANSDGVRGSGSRVMRRFPEIPEWTATFEVLILDPIITEPVFVDMLEKAGVYVGVGRFRPERGGLNGRFAIKKISWEDNRKLVRKAA